MSGDSHGAQRIGRLARRVGRFLAPWTALGLFFATQVRLEFAYAGETIGWSRAIALGLVDWYAWAACSPVLYLLARRFPLERGRWLASVVVHLPVTIVVTACKLLAESLIVQWLAWLPSRSSGSAKLHASLMACWLIVGACHALLHRRAAEDRRRRAAELEASLSRARLEVLRGQLQPHFLFNTLHAIGALMHRDVAAADRMLTRLGDLLRISLEAGDQPEVPLEKELELTELYLEIQRVRFADRLQAQVTVDPECLRVRVPPMILQPLVENALVHGLETDLAPACVEVRAERVAEAMVLTVLDDGPGPPDAAVEGVGLANTRARLRELHGDAAGLTLRAREGRGSEVALRVPWRPAS